MHQLAFHSLCLGFPRHGEVDLNLDSEVEAVSQPSVLNVKSLILFAFC
jgi:hypothetical protein